MSKTLPKVQQVVNMAFTVQNISEAINGFFEKHRLPVNSLPAKLLYCVAENRAGLSAYKTTAKIIANNKALGIPTDPNPDGSENMINQYTYNVVKAIFDAMQNDAMVNIAIPENSILVKTDGGNAGGPVVSIGRNLLASISKGIIQ